MIIIIAVLGLILGSFVNALVWRLRQQDLQRQDMETDATQRRHSSSYDVEKFSILTGRSMCTECHHVLASKDLIPLMSWLLLAGKCRYCHAPISSQYPFVEATTAILFVTSYIWWPFTFDASSVFSFSVWLIFLTAFMALIIYDIRWFLLPDRIVFPLIGLATTEVLVRTIIFGAGWSMVLQSALGAVCLAGLFLVLHVLSKGTWIGFGDVKLAIVLGLLAGSITHVMLLLFMASVLGTFIAIPLLVRGRANAKTQLPFGAFLLISTIFVVLFGTSSIHWYLHLLSVQ